MADNDEAFTPETNPNIGGGEIVGPGGTGPYTPSSNDVRVKDTYAMAVRIKSQLDAINQTLATLQTTVNKMLIDDEGYYYDAAGVRTRYKWDIGVSVRSTDNIYMHTDKNGEWTNIYDEGEE